MRTILEAIRTEIAALAGKSDEDIDLSDAPATTHKYWQESERGRFYRTVKQQRHPAGRHAQSNQR